jgi:hypothetical protein
VRFVAALAAACLLLLSADVHAHDRSSATHGAQAKEVAKAAAEDVAPGAASTPTAADLQRARVLFQRGVQLAQRRQFSSAAKRFSEALEIHYAPAVEYNLASALYETGKYADAYNRTQSVLAHLETPEKVRQRAEKLERALHPYVSRLTVLTGGETSDMQVQVDGRELDRRLLGRAQAVAPGTHEVVATRGRTTIARREVNIPLRTAAIIDVSLVLAADEAARLAAAARPGVAPSAPVDRTNDSDRKRKLRRWVGIAAGVTAVAVGATVGVVLASD